MGCGHSKLSCCKPPKKVKDAGREVCLPRGGEVWNRSGAEDARCRGLPPVGRGCQAETCPRPARRDVGRARPGGALSPAAGWAARGSPVYKHGSWARKGQLILAARVGKSLLPVAGAFSPRSGAVWAWTSDLTSLALRLSYHTEADHL